MSRRINAGQRMKEAVKFIKKIDTKKMILVAGISLMSFFSFGKFVYAAPEVSVQCKNTAETIGSVKYQLRMAECEYNDLASDIEFHKGNIDGDSNKVTPEILEEMSNGDIVAVVEVPAETTNLVIKDKNANENETTVVLSGENVSIPVATSIKVKDNLIEYNSPEYGKYIHVTLESTAKIWSIKDADDKDRIWLKEKEEDNLVTLKYILKDDETNPDKLYFTVYDVFGNSKKVDIKDALIQVEFNAKNVDGSTFVFKASKSFQKKLEGQDTASTFELVNIKTGALEDIEMHTSNEQGDKWENNYKYVNVPEGTTKLLLTYKVPNPEYKPEAPGDTPKYIENITEEFVVPLWLDVTDPEGIYYKINKEQVLSSYEINGDIIENNYNRYVIERVKGNIRKYTTDILNPENENQQVRVRAYVNNTTKKCIVEVRDMQSGIDKIELCKLNTAAEEGASDEIKYPVIEGADVTAANYNSHGNLEASVLHLFDLSTAADFSEKIAAVKVTDGLENYMYIPVEKSASGDGATSDYGADADTLVLAKLIEEHVDGKTIYKIVAQDYKAGLWKIERDGVNTPLVEFDEADKLKINSAKRDFTQGDGVVEYTDHEGESGQENENNIKITIDGDRYEQYTLRRVTRKWK